MKKNQLDLGQQKTTKKSVIMRLRQSLEVMNFGFSQSALLVTTDKLIYIVLTLFAGLMSGLTVGMLSIDKMDLEIKSVIGTEAEKRQVKIGDLISIGC